MAKSQTEKKPQKRSPLRDGPARVPAQSLEAHVQSLVENKALFWTSVAVFPAVFAMME